MLKKSECEFRENFDLTASSGAKLPSFAKLVVYPDSEEKFIKIISGITEYQVTHKIVGGMTNLLIKNGVFNGVIVKTDKLRIKSLAENQVALGCGVRMGGVIHKMASFNLGGMEGLAGIPGTVGGMVKQNAGAFGYEISDVFNSCLCYLPDEKRTVTLSKDDMEFGYRQSVLKDSKSVLVSATFDFIPGCKEEILRKITAFRNRRIATQPAEYPSLGSVFKKHNGQSAGFYIEKAGLKGVCIGGAQISVKHAGFIVNKGGATADDFLRLMDYAKERVYLDFGIELEEEIEII